MKDLKIISAVFVAALMVVAAGAIAFNAADSDAGSSSSSPTLTSDEMEHLMDLLNYSQATVTDQSLGDSYTVGYGQVLFLSKNYSANANATITVEDGGAIALCPLQSFSITGNNLKIVMEEGSTFAIVSADPGTVAGLEDVEITMSETEDNEAYALTGTITNTAVDLVKDTGVPGFKLSISKGAVVNEVSPTTTEVYSSNTFNEENSIEVRLASVVLAPAPNVDIAVNVAIDMTTVTDEEDMKAVVNGTPTYAVKVNVDGTTLTAKITGDGSITADIYKTDVTPEKKMMTVTYANSINANARITDYDDDEKAKMYFDGSATVTVRATDVYYEEKEGDKVVMTGELSGVYANLNIGFRGDEVTLNADAGLGYYATYGDNNGTTDLMKDTEIRNVGISFRYTAKSADPAAMALAIPMSGLDSSITVSPSVDPTKMILDMAKMYFAAMPPEDIPIDINAYAAEFFFSMLAGYLPFSTDEMTSEYLYADVSLGSLFVAGKINASGINASVEISDSVGARANISVGKFYQYSEDSTTMIEPLNISVHTSRDRTVFLELDASANLEVKDYDEGVLDSDMFVQGGNLNIAVKQNTKVAAGAEYVINSASISQIGVGYDGVFMIINGISYDTTDKKLVADNMHITGDFYGFAKIRSVEGYAYNLEMPFDINSLFSITAGPSMSPTIGSADVTVYDLYGNSLRVTRDYDLQKSTISNRFIADGPVWVSDMFGSGSPLTSVLNMKFTGEAATPTVNNDFSGVFITNAVCGVSEDNVTVLTPGFVLTVDGISVYDGSSTPVIAGKFTGEIYTSPMRSNGNNLGASSVTIYGDRYDVLTAGCAFGVSLDSAGEPTYKLVALPEYRLEPGTETGFTFDSYNDSTATITVTGSAPYTLKYGATSRTFNVVLDGKVVKEDAKYNESISVDVGDASLIFDEYGNPIGTIFEKVWSYTRSKGTGDLRVTSATFTPYTKDISSEEPNVVEADSAQFTFAPAASGKYAFVMSSGVRFDINGTANAEVQLLAKETNYNGNRAFIVKATVDGAPLASKLYIPVGGEGQKVMHVDQYGRAQEFQSTYKVIDGQAYQIVSVSDYSIFYTTADVPSYDTGGNSKNNNLLYIGIAVVVAVVALAGVAYFLKTKQSAA